MNRFRLIVSSLRYHARGNVAVLLGAAVGAAPFFAATPFGEAFATGPNGNSTAPSTFSHPGGSFAARLPISCPVASNR